MKKIYIAIGGLVSLGVLGVEEASAGMFSMGGMRPGMFQGGAFRSAGYGAGRFGRGGFNGGGRTFGTNRYAPSCNYCTYRTTSQYPSVRYPKYPSVRYPVQYPSIRYPMPSPGPTPVSARPRRYEYEPPVSAKMDAPVQVAPPTPRVAPGPRQTKSTKQVKPVRQVAKTEPRKPTPQAQRAPAKVTPPKPPSNLARRPPSPHTPPAASSDNRFVPDELLVEIRNRVSPSEVNNIARQNRLTLISSQRLELTGSMISRYRIPDGRQVADVVRALEEDVRIASVQPNFVYRLAGDPVSNAPSIPQYSVSKMQLPEAHRLSTGRDVVVGVIDSGIDSAHPELAGSIADAFDAVDGVERPDKHGTAVAGVIASHANLLGVAPGAKLLAIRAFTNRGGKLGEGGTTDHIVRSIEWAHQRGARVINMSFTGPRDRLLSYELRAGVEKGMIFVAAAGEAPNAAGADDSVIAVTASDAADKLYKTANQGPHVCIAAPGVDVVVAAPSAAHGYMSGTSLAAAHVSGAIALLLQSRPELNARAVRTILLNRARRLSAAKAHDDCGIGFTDALALVTEPGERRALQEARSSAAADRPELSTGSVNRTTTPSGGQTLISPSPGGMTPR